MPEYIIHTRIHCSLEDDDEAKLQVANLLVLYKIAVEESNLQIDGVELGLLRDGQPVELPTDQSELLKPGKDT